MVKDEAYRIYVSECLRMTTENTANLSRGTYMKAKYADLIKPKQEETRTAEQIITSIKAKLGG